MAASSPPAGNQYQTAVAAIAGAQSPDGLETAVDDYLSATAQLEPDARASESQFAALVAGDLRVLAELARLDVPDGDQPVALSVDAQAERGSAFSADMNLVLAGIGGGLAPQSPLDDSLAALAEATPAEVASAAIDAIVSEGGKAAGKVLAAFAVPQAGAIVGVAKAVAGQDGAQLAQQVIDAVNWVAKKVKSAIARVLGALLDRLTNWLGNEQTASEVLDKAKGWLKDKAGELQPLNWILGIGALKEAVGQSLAQDPGTAAGRAGKAKDLVSQHAQAQRWIRWGATALGVAGTFHLEKAVPWGTALVSSTGAALLVVCVWMTNDYLDARDWPVKRVTGVRTVVLAA